jgi:hypothetical protein
MKRNIRSRRIDTIFVLIVFSIFAFSVLMVLMLGAGVYRNVNDISRDGKYRHTAMSYIWTKTRIIDNADSISVGDFNGIPALFIDEKLGDTDYRTAIYGYDGWLYELFSEKTLEFSPSDGTPIVIAENLVFRDIGDGLIEVTAGDLRLLLSPRS